MNLLKVVAERAGEGFLLKLDQGIKITTRRASEILIRSGCRSSMAEQENSCSCSCKEWTLMREALLPSYDVPNGLESRLY
jgi:hypothetical protein